MTPNSTMPDETAYSGAAMHALMSELFPICRSLSGEGVRQSLRILGRHLPIEVHEVPSGTPVFDWVVPDEWAIREAWVADQAGRHVIDFAEHNLHVVSYSEPFEGELTLDELLPHLHTRPDLPDAIPYVTSYYERTWGFCLRHRDLAQLTPQTYSVRIDSTLEPGSLTYGEVRIPGEGDDEVLLATNICHPSMANNELSGPVLTTFLARRLLARAPGRYAYRILFLPETIGAIAYLAGHADEMKRRTVAGYQVVCVGGADPFTYLRSRRGDSLTDRISQHVLAHGGDHRILDFAHRASDERQWCSPGIDLPVGSLMRSKYHEYPEYHTSLDDLDLVRPEHLQAAFDTYCDCLQGLDENRTYRATVAGCEPNLGRRGLYPTLGGRSHDAPDVDDLLAVLAYADGEHDLLSIAEIHEKPISAYRHGVEKLLEAGLIEEIRG